MKKTLLRIFALVLTLCTVFSLASCFAPKPKLDLEAAKENLEDEDYIVSYVDDEDVLDTNVAERLVARDEDGETALTVVVYSDAKSAKIAYKIQQLNYDYQIEAYNMQIDYYELEIKALKNKIRAYDDELKSDEIDALEEKIEEYEDDVDDLKDELKEYKKDYVIARRGKTLWYGYKDAIKDSKG